MKVLKIAAIAVALVAGFYAPTLLKSFSSSSIVKPLDEYCLLSTTACVQQGATMTLNVDNAQPLIPAKFDVEWNKSDAEQLVLSLSGREMEMGEPKFLLKKIAPGKYSGEVVLPVCTQESMTWVGELTDGQSTIYPAIKMQR
ncbi:MULTISPECIES: hypothetical protein [Vibrio]|uniref:hypothetical protein n=1 Tax=Vibrio TaxID=662 RepID=UPI00084ADB5C|nr:hypothetical protein [Vibrio parahaemolyticus]ELH3115101.1 hypothetical protein [Vibrio parahaemolyticus]MBM5029737.1 hypothetical protein [Vibrio parahaemolyticus]MBO0151680.1 hypothetical protein [Vibrio parahaemolyticus]MBO0182029.1 hypothetical protein [Vibrio parahaemolyticus]MBO0191793.1 hypothetical protein [Vibrio parahaemolyticus]